MKGKIAENLKENKILYVTVAILLVLTTITGYFAFTIPVEDTKLIVDEVYFMRSSQDADATTITLIVFITNNGETSIDNLKVRAFAVEKSSNLAMGEDTVDLGGIAGKKTSEGELVITVPNDDAYRLELLVFENERISIRGAGSIDLTGVGSVKDYNTITPTSEKGIDDMYGGDSSASFGFTTFCCITLFITCVLVLIIIIIVRDNKKRKEVFKETKEKDTPENDHVNSDEEKVEPKMNEDVDEVE